MLRILATSLVALAAIGFSPVVQAQSVDAKKVAEDLSAKHVAAFNKGDASALVESFAQDIMYLSAVGSPPLFSRAEYEKRWAGIFAATAPQEKVTVIKAEAVDAKTILVVGEWYAGATKGPTAGKEGHGYWFAVDVMDNGEWRTKVLTVNTELTPAGEAVASGSSNKQ
jgi:ketosteroid isomerase-like protein